MSTDRESDSVGGDASTVSCDGDIITPTGVWQPQEFLAPYAADGAPTLAFISNNQILSLDFYFPTSYCLQNFLNYIFCAYF